MDFFSKILKEEEIYEIFSYLSIKDLLKCNLVCKKWLIISNGNELWREKVIKKYPEFKNFENGWKLYFSLFRKAKKMEQKSRINFNKIAPRLGFKYLSGNISYYMNHPVLYAFGFAQNESLVVSAQNYYQEFTISNLIQAISKFLKVLEKCGYCFKLEEENKENK
ncbi:f-box only protein [Anaeramoeba ignava]|uniref:F-box only protein n=1 Tax=Anaeramoeba ignava TaxID=1746090 RepID=A0A9Q0RFS9_ANAIG|nr:f-box only protein [Anaeramoeba ignava]